MEPTADIDLGPETTHRERMERLLTVGGLVFVLAVLGSLISAYLAL